jgi:hypothetical protein
MRPAAAIALITALSIACPAAAAQRQPVKSDNARSAAAPDTPNAADVRADLERLLDQYPPSLGRILKLDPTLLANPAYLQAYPTVASFVGEHPEVTHNPDYFLANYEIRDRGPVQPWREDPKDRAFNIWRGALNGLFITMIFAAIAGALAWLIKTVIEHRRWNRLSRIQADVHTKLLERFTSNEDLLAYMQTPAGRRFFESGPMPVEGPRVLNAPLGRILWSAQVGAVLGLTGIGIEIVSARAIEEIGQPLSAIGIVIIAIAIGFGVSAVMAYVLSRRLGLIAASEPRG